MQQFLRPHPTPAPEGRGWRRFKISTKASSSTEYFPPPRPSGRSSSCLHQHRMWLREPARESVWKVKDLKQISLSRRGLGPSRKYDWGGEVMGLDSTKLWGPCDCPPGCSARSGASKAANFQGARGPSGDLARGRGPGAPLPRAASSERLPSSSSSGSGTRRDGAGRSMGLAGSGGGQRHGGQQLHALAGPGQPTRGSCAPRSIIPPGGGAAGAGPAGTLPPALRSWSTPPPRLSCRDARRAQSYERCHPPTGGKSHEKCLT